MATGALDANGVWIYGEDDSELTFSALLNKGMESVSDVVAQTGLVNVIPTTVQQAGGSASFNAKGLVTFSTVTSLSLNGVFTSKYKNYRIVIGELLGNAALTNFGIRLRNAGVDNAASQYFFAYRYFTVGGGNLAFNGSTQNIAYLGAFANDDNASAVIDVLAPQSNRKTKLSSTLNGNDGSALSVFVGGSYHNLTASFDGITFNVSSGSMSGTLAVYGYNN